ncbi:dual specificity phosphatase, catalytic domain-containing protein [Ditylenchus destructor]|uniref:Phosphatidylglycerophosphatase and protein-tyrosine phosphatase 1 n=1 Tax=Ditylenchus destructor TaxID=166010 RepID=A0AAD4N8P6_9BILA|nr:dual specificity phosphatase, catalytic domain-containing protein [Ditylenchus destructor]
MLGPFAFYPTLGYNLLRNYLQPLKWSWYNRIDDDVILGALPFKSMVEDLKREKVGGVVCCVEEYELNAPNAMQPSDWEKNEIKFHHIPMQDFTGSTSRQNVQKAVKFIEGVAAEGKTCYVHCKAGRTRSATIVTCYLMKKHDYLPNVAIELMKLKRPQVILHDAHWRTVNEFRRFLDKRRNSSVSSTSSV